MQVSSSVLTDFTSNNKSIQRCYLDKDPLGLLTRSSVCTRTLLLVHLYLLTWHMCNQEKTATSADALGANSRNTSTGEVLTQRSSFTPPDISTDLC